MRDFQEYRPEAYGILMDGPVCVGSFDYDIHSFDDNGNCVDCGIAADECDF